MPPSINAIALGIIALFFCGRWVVEGAVILASSMGVSEYLISATIIAVGTSLPELFTSISAARKGEDDMAVGNIGGDRDLDRRGRHADRRPARREGRAPHRAHPLRRGGGTREFRRQGAAPEHD